MNRKYILVIFLALLSFNVTFADEIVALDSASVAGKQERIATQRGQKSAKKMQLEREKSAKNDQARFRSNLENEAKAEKYIIDSLERVRKQAKNDYNKQKKSAEKLKRDSLSYRKVLGLQFNKNVDYSSSINYFEDKDNYALLEKGVAFASFNLGLASFQMDNKWIEPLVKIGDTYYTQFFVKASGGYFIANNTALAVKVSYGFYDNRISLSSDILQLLINAKNYETNNVGTDVAVSAVIRNYVPIGIQQRFFIVTETALGYKYSESFQRNIYDFGARISKVETHSHRGMLGISPGVTYFMTKGFAFEFMLSPIQIYYQNTQSINNEVEHGSSNSYGLSFAFTPLNIQLGFSYYFGLDYRKNHSYMTKYYKNDR